MTDRIFIDTNILVYTLDAVDNVKQQKAKTILNNFYDDRRYRVSTQVIQEFCNVVLKKIEPRVSEKDLSGFISTIPDDRVESIDINIIRKALAVKEEFKYSFWDSLIIASAISSGCNILYSEDMKKHHVIENLRIINPFD